MAERQEHNSGGRSGIGRGFAPISGLSLLLIVAMTVQVNAGLRSGGRLEGRLEREARFDAPRLAIAAPVRSAERAVRKQSERPAIALQKAADARRWSARIEMGADEGPGRRRLSTWLTNLPPPGCA